MPKEYERCKESYIKKGTPEKKAKAICAGMYYNRHGITVKEAEKRGLKSMLYVARTKSSLETILDSLEDRDYVIVPITEEIRQKLKSYQPKVENEQYKYIAVHKSLVDVTKDAKLVLRLEKLKENETSKQNEHNEPKVEHVQGVVKDGKVKSLSSELMDEDVDVETKAEEKLPEKLPTLSEVMSKVAKGKKLNRLERHILSVALDAVKSSKSTTKEEREEARRDLENEEISEKTRETLHKEFGSEKDDEDMEEQKTLSATDSTVQAVESEDMEPQKEDEKEDEEKLKSWNSLLKSFGSLDPNTPIFNSKQEADRFARYYKLYYGQAVVRPAGLKEVRTYGSKAKYVVDIE